MSDAELGETSSTLFGARLTVEGRVLESHGIYIRGDCLHGFEEFFSFIREGVKWDGDMLDFLEV